MYKGCGGYWCKWSVVVGFPEEKAQWEMTVAECSVVWDCLPVHLHQYSPLSPLTQPLPYLGLSSAKLRAAALSDHSVLV